MLVTPMMENDPPRTPADYRRWWVENTDVVYGSCWCGCGEKTSLAKQTVRSKGCVRGQPRRYVRGHQGKSAADKPRPSRRRFSETQEREICARYEAGESSTALAQRLGVHAQIITGALRRGGVDLRSAMKLTEAQQEEAVRLYREGLSVNRIGRVFGTSADTICRLLERNGIARTGGRRYEYDESFFNRIDTQEQAYWLGFIAADGNVSRNGGRLVIRLAAKDRSHLERFNACLQSNKPVVDGTVKAFGKEYESASLDFASRALVDGLRIHGITSNKSLTHEWPHFLPDPLVRHYLRGYFDGDGTYHTSVREAWKIAASLLGTRPFLEGCRTVLVFRCKLSENAIRRKGARNRAYVLRYSGRLKVQRFARFLYADATVYLPRKREKVAHLL